MHYWNAIRTDANLANALSSRRRRHVTGGAPPPPQARPSSLCETPVRSFPSPPVGPTPLSPYTALLQAHRLCHVDQAFDANHGSSQVCRSPLLHKVLVPIRRRGVVFGLQRVRKLVQTVGKRLVHLPISHCVVQRAETLL